MLPATQASLVSQMRVTPSPRKAAADLGRYLQLEYGVNASAARTMIDHAREGRRVQIRTGTKGPVRRFFLAVFEAVASIRASPGSA
jgi:hypothetical protein